MDTRKVIAVVGATGAQGGGLVRAILADPNSREGGASSSVSGLLNDAGRAEAG